MTLKEIAVKELMRRKGKAAFVLAGLAIGVATVVAVLSFVNAVTNDITQKLEKYGANILIVPRTDFLALSYGGLTLGGVSFDAEEIRQDDLAKINSIKNYRNIAAMGPMVLGSTKINQKPVLVAGIDFKAAEILKPWWKVKGASPGADQVLLGAEAARVLGLTAGEAFPVNGRTLTVSGVLLPTGSQDDQLAFTHLSTAQSLFDKGGRVSMVEVAALCNACPIDDMVRQISRVLPSAKVMAIQQVVKGRMETLAHFRKFSLGISAVVVVIAGLVVLVTLMGSVRERTDEIGIFRALGFRKRHVMGIIFLEVAMISALAGILGYAVGIGGTKIAVQLFSGIQASAVPLDWKLAAGSLFTALVIGLAASAYPASMAARLDPNEALRSL